MPHKVSTGGSYRIDRRIPQVGRLAIATGCTSKKAFEQAEACILRLRANGTLDVLRALKDGKVMLAEVLAAEPGGRPAFDVLLASLRPAAPSPESVPWWPAVEAWLGPVETRGRTKRRYGQSLTKLKRTGALAETEPVSALAAVDWEALLPRWEGSGADWNHCRRAVSRFLTKQLGDVYHPMRRGVMKAYPKQAEPERVPDLDLPTFWRVVEATPEHVRPAFVTLVTLGLRVGEYLRLRETDLHPITKTVSIPGTKTKGSVAVLAVAPELWPWIVQGVPAPVGYNWLRRYWKRALAAVEADVTLRLHDLRHLTAQVLVNTGRTEASVQSTMRHATASMTRRYAKQRDRGENAKALARALLEARTA